LSVPSTFFLKDSILGTGYHPPPPPPPPPPPDEPPPPLPELDPGGEDEEEIVEEKVDPRLEARPVAPWVYHGLPEYQVGEYPCSICA